MIFDDISESEVTEVMVRSLRMGIPEKRIVNGIPDFLVRKSK